MRATGIIRRIDDIGRIVIPEEIRRTMHIHEGDPLEIFLDTETDSVCFSKYHALGIENEAIINIALNMAQATKAIIAIYNEDWRITHDDGKGIFPPDVPDGWRSKRQFFETDKLFVVPVINNGECYGYVATNSRSITHREVIMIARYISAALED